MSGGGYDVVVIGGGPGGAAAALEAARSPEEPAVVVLEAGVPREERPEPGADSTDAAGLLDYWRDLAGLDDDLLSGLIEREIEQVRFLAGDGELTIEETGENSAYERIAYTFDRVGLDDRLQARAVEAGADYRTGARVTDVTTRVEDGSIVHAVETAGGDHFEAGALVLADGPKRQVTVRALSQFYPRERLTGDVLGPAANNHVAYQEHRRVPEAVFEEIGSELVFWWGDLPGETAYTWAFPNADRVVRFGLTMPPSVDFGSLEDPTAHRLIEPDDDDLPPKSTLIRRLLEAEFGDDYDVAEAFPRVTDRGKREGTEAYAISSMRPIDSPVRANIAVVGGAMGSTSAFHEGGYHTAVGSGRIAGRLAASGDLDRYNRTWKADLGREIAINVVFAEVFGEYGPAEWEATLSSGMGALEVEMSGPLGVLGLVPEYVRNRTMRRNVNDLLGALAREFGGNSLRAMLPGDSGPTGRYDCVKLAAHEYRYDGLLNGAESGG